MIELHFLPFYLFLMNIFQILQLFEYILWVWLSLLILDWFDLLLLNFSLKRSNLWFHVLTLFLQFSFLNLAILIMAFVVITVTLIFLKLNELLFDKVIILNSGLWLDGIKILLVMFRDHRLFEMWMLLLLYNLIKFRKQLLRCLHLNLLLH